MRLQPAVTQSPSAGSACREPNSAACVSGTPVATGRPSGSPRLRARRAESRPAVTSSTTGGRSEPAHSGSTAFSQRCPGIDRAPVSAALTDPIDSAPVSRPTTQPSSVVKAWARAATSGASASSHASLPGQKMTAGARPACRISASPWAASTAAPWSDARRSSFPEAKSTVSSSASTMRLCRMAHTPSDRTSPHRAATSARHDSTSDQMPSASRFRSRSVMTMGLRGRSRLATAWMAPVASSATTRVPDEPMSTPR